MRPQATPWTRASSEAGWGRGGGWERHGFHWFLCHLKTPRFLASLPVQRDEAKGGGLLWGWEDQEAALQRRGMGHGAAQGTQVGKASPLSHKPSSQELLAHLSAARNRLTRKSRKEQSWLKNPFYSQAVLGYTSHPRGDSQSPQHPTSPGRLLPKVWLLFCRTERGPMVSTRPMLPSHLFQEAPFLDTPFLPQRLASKGAPQSRRPQACPPQQRSPKKLSQRPWAAPPIPSSWSRADTCRASRQEGAFFPNRWGGRAGLLGGRCGPGQPDTRHHRGGGGGQ